MCTYFLFSVATILTMPRRFIQVLILLRQLLGEIIYILMVPPDINVNTYASIKANKDEKIIVGLMVIYDNLGDNYLQVD
jgi:hypothetical protein